MSKSKRSAAAKKAAATRRRNAAKRSAAAKKAVRSRRRKSSTKRKRNAWYGQKRRHATAAKKGHRRRKRRLSPKRRRRNPSAIMATKRRRSGKRKSAVSRYRRRRNPSSGTGVMQIITKHAIPVAASLYIARFVSGKVADKIPMIDKIPAQFRSPVLAAGFFAAGHFATNKLAPLKKHRSSIMIGLGINLIDKVLVAFAPANVSSMFGLGQDEDDYYGPMSDYVAVGEMYQDLGNGAPPIEDDITLNDYVQVGQFFETENIPGLEEELGEIYADLGVEEDLGQVPGGADFADRRLGGVTRSSMQAPIGSKKFVAPVPERSFTKKVPEFGPGFDKRKTLWTGIFSGGFGGGYC